MLKREHQQNTCLSNYASHQQCRQAWDEITAKTAAALLKYINNTIQLQYTQTNFWGVLQDESVVREKVEQKLWAISQKLINKLNRSFRELIKLQTRMKGISSSLQQMEENVINAAIADTTADSNPSQPLWKTCPLSTYVEGIEEMNRMYKQDIYQKKVLLDDLPKQGDRNVLIIYFDVWKAQPFILTKRIAEIQATIDTETSPSLPSKA